MSTTVYFAEIATPRQVGARMYENAAVCQGGKFVKLFSAPFIPYSSLIARSRFTGCMYSPISGHEHLPGGVALNERAQNISCEPRAYLLGDGRSFR